MSTVKYASGTLLVGDCLETLKTLPDNSVDSVVTDPPYEIGFMGKAWDSTGIAYSVQLWQECLRVLKPGGHLLSFGATRSYHRMAVAIEDAGFEIRDSIHWTYGSGFPKSLNVGKAIDKQKANRDEVYRFTGWVRAARDAAGITNKDIDDAFGFAGMSGHWTSSKSQPSVPTLEQIPKLLGVLGVDEMPADIQELALRIIQAKGKPGPNWFKREKVGESDNGIAGGTGRHAGEDNSYGFAGEYDITAPDTEQAARWEGWGTALKPSHEPIVVARKPLVGTVAQNVLQFGTGGINIDASRVGVETVTINTFDNGAKPFGGAIGEPFTGRQSSGRWPANTILTHSAGCRQTGETETPVFQCVPGCPVQQLDNQSGTLVKGSQAKRLIPKNHAFASDTYGTSSTEYNGKTVRGYTDPAGGASRFFQQTVWNPEYDLFHYTPKPSKKERNAGLEHLTGRQQDPTRKPGAPGGDNPRNRGGNPTRLNHHPTVKPVSLIRYLIRMFTPPGGVVCDPFLGSGTTAVAAILEGFQWVGCELTEEYVPIITGRVEHAEATLPTSEQLEL